MLPLSHFTHDHHDQPKVTGRAKEMGRGRGLPGQIQPGQEAAGTAARNMPAAEDSAMHLKL